MNLIDVLLVTLLNTVVCIGLPKALALFGSKATSSTSEFSGDSSVSPRSELS